MQKRFISALFGVVLAVVSAAGAAQARVEKFDSQGSRYDASLTRANMGKNFRGAKNRYASVKPSSKRYAAKGYRKVAYKKGSNRKLAKRSFTRYASNGGGGGTSRGCLTSEARALLARIESRFGPVQIVSTCRPGAVIAGSGKPSKHRYGQAIDFNAGSRKGAIVSWLIQNHHSGGTMTYAGMNHIHVDIGYRFVKLNHGGRSRA